MIENGYVLTNAHVVWPVDEVDLTFPDGKTFENVSVRAIDNLWDLAILGPIATYHEQQTLGDSTDIPIGSETLLIGYPGEDQSSPTLSQGLVSNLRTWVGTDLTLLQTDHSTVGGQSGGALVSDTGEIVGISTFSINEGTAVLSVSAADAKWSVSNMEFDSFTAGNASWLSAELVGADLRDARSDHEIPISHEYDSVGFVIDSPPDNLEISVTTTGPPQDVSVLVTDLRGQVVSSTDEFGSGPEQILAPIEADGPHFVALSVWEPDASTFEVECNCEMRLFTESDSPQQLVLDESYIGRLDHPSDYDYYEIELEAGQSVDARVESISMDPYVTIGWIGGPPNLRSSDDDSGGGILGRAADAFFTAPEAGTYIIQVSDASLAHSGSYLIAVRNLEKELAPDPPAPERNFATVETALGQMSVFEGVDVPYTANIPTDWPHLGPDPDQVTVVDEYGASFRGPTITFEEDPNASAEVEGDFTAGAHADRITEVLGLFGLTEVVSRTDPEPGAALDVVQLEFSVVGGFTARYLYYVHTDSTLVAVQVLGNESQMADISEIIDHTFESFNVAIE